MITQIDVNPWGRRLYVVVGETDARVKAFFKKREGFQECFTIDPASEAETVVTDKGHVVIRFGPVTKEPTALAELIAHECMHATYRMLSYVGIALTLDTDEVYAYQLEYLIREVTKAIKKTKRK